MADTSGVNPEVREQTAPRWLRTAGGVSWRLLVVLAAVVIVFFALSKVQLVVIAVFLAFVITAVLRPLVGWMSRVMPRGLAVGLSLLLGTLFLLGMLTYVVYSVANQWNSLSKQFGQGIQQITDWLTGGHLPFQVTNDQVSQWIDQGVQWVQGHAGQIAGQAAASAGSAVEVFTATIIAVFCAIFFLARGAEMWTWLLNQLPARVRSGWITAGRVGWSSFSGYTRGIVIIAVTDGVLAFTWLAVLLPVSFGVYGLIRKRVPVESTTGLMVCTPSSIPGPTDGVSQCCTPPPNTSSQPPTRASTARMPIGTVMTAFASCGWTSSSQRRLPRKVITSARVM